MTEFFHRLQQWVTTRLVVGLFAVTMLIFFTMLFYTIPAVEHFAPGKQLFDLSPSGYSYLDAISLLDALGSEGRSVYLTLQLPLDFIYPALFAVTCSLLLAWTFSKGFSPESKIYYFSVVPVLAGLFDYLENICIISMLNTWPDISRALVNISSAFTILKSGFSTVFFILFFVGIFYAVKNRRNNSGF